MTDQEIQDVAERILKQDASRPGFLGAIAVSGSDFDGDPIIRVTARYEVMPRPARPLHGMHAIRTELLKLGEDRIVFLTNEYEDEPVVAEDDVG